MHCELLEDYICRLLDPDMTARFENHLSECQSCREAVDHEHSIFDALKEATESLEPCPPTLCILKSTPTPNYRQPSRGRLAVVASTVSLVLLTAVVLRTQPASEPVRDTGPGIAQISDSTFTPPAIQIHGNARSFPVESGDPNIQIMMITMPPSSQSTEPTTSLATSSPIRRFP